MLGYIWFSMILLSVITGIYNNNLDMVINEAVLSAQRAFEFTLGLGGLMTFWLGIMKIAEKAGIIHDVGHVFTPVLHWLFPSIPKDHPAMGAITFNLAANFLGLSNAATPFGLKAMEELQTLNPDPSTASDDMCMFLAINNSSIQLIPATAIGLLGIAGSKDPMVIVFTTIIATSISTIVAIFTSFKLSKHYS